MSHCSKKAVRKDGSFLQHAVQSKLHCAKNSGLSFPILFIYVKKWSTSFRRRSGFPWILLSIQISTTKRYLAPRHTLSGTNHPTASFSKNRVATNTPLPYSAPTAAVGPTDWFFYSAWNSSPSFSINGDPHHWHLLFTVYSVEYSGISESSFRLQKYSPAETIITDDTILHSHHSQSRGNCHL